MALLMTTIWSFHIQYMQPPTFYLKAPTLLYVFIFIALRALRFEARYVILAGVTAAIGWLILVGFAAVQSGDAAITRDYIHYMTHNALLLA
jgi:adenylate cyclase